MLKWVFMRSVSGKKSHGDKIKIRAVLKPPGFGIYSVCIKENC